MNDWDQDIYHLNDEQPQPKRGSILVAKPTVGDFFFRRSLVLIVDPDEGEGAMGVVVNHYMGYNLRDIMPDIETVEEIPLYIGGPVGTQMLFYMHTLGPEIVPEAIDIGDGVWFGGDFDAIKRYVELGRLSRAASNSSWATAGGRRTKSPVSSSGMIGQCSTTVEKTCSWAKGTTTNGVTPCHALATVTACGSTCPAIPLVID